MNKLESKINEVILEKFIDSFQSTYLDKAGTLELVLFCTGGGQHEGATIRLRCNNSVAVSGNLFAHKTEKLIVRISKSIPQDWKIDLDDGYTILEIETHKNQKLMAACFDITCEFPD